MSKCITETIIDALFDRFQPHDAQNIVKPREATGWQWVLQNRIDNIKRQPIWLTANIPGTARPGLYKGTLSVSCGAGVSPAAAAGTAAPQAVAAGTTAPQVSGPTIAEVPVEVVDDNAANPKLPASLATRAKAMSDKWLAHLDFNRDRVANGGELAQDDLYQTAAEIQAALGAL